jgi:hypothetical protein
VGWRDADWAEHDRDVSTVGHGRAIIWGALAVVFLAVGGVLLSLIT